MSENEKLRALLAEARGRIGSCECGDEACEPQAEFVRRLDAALAEPVRACPKCTRPMDLVARDDYKCLLCDAEIVIEALCKERDEARAEVERLRFELRKVEAYSAGPTWLTHQESIAAAYQRGAEAMREAAAHAVEGWLQRDDVEDYDDAIRALPIPEVK